MKLRSLAGSALLAISLLAATGAAAQGIIIDEGGVRIAPPVNERGPQQNNGGYNRNNDRGPDYEESERGIGPREARRIARSAGVVNTYDVDRRGPVWVVEGVDRRGRGLRVTISARSGDIVDVDRSGRG